MWPLFWRHHFQVPILRECILGLNQVWLEFVHKGSVGDMSTLVQAIDWLRTGKTHSVKECIHCIYQNRINGSTTRLLCIISHEIKHIIAISLIAKYIGSTSIRYRPEVKVSDRYLIDVDRRLFAIWDYSSDRTMISVFGRRHCICRPLYGQLPNVLNLRVCL